MANEQAAGPVKDNPPAGGTPAKDATALTGATTTSTPSSLTTGATPELPHAWMTGLTTEQKADADLVKSLSKFEKGIPDLAKSYVELEKKAGQAIVLPGEKATPEEMARFRKAVGVPEKPEDYKLEKVELPNGNELDGQWDKELRALAHKLNLSQGQLGGLHEWYFKNLVAEMQLVKTTAEQATATLRKEMGVEYEAAVTYKTRAVDKFLNPTTKVLFERSGLGNHPEILKMFMAIGKAMGEHFFAEGNRGQRVEEAPFGKRSDAELAAALYGDKK